MKTYKFFFCIAILSVILAGCTKETYNDTSFINTATDAANLSAYFNITQDNSGLVTITPTGEGVSTYQVYFGDGTATPVSIAPGKSTTHKYAEGVYDVRIVASNINGVETEVVKKITVSFKAPENFEVSAAIDAVNKYQVNVSAKAVYETHFVVLFGEGANEIPRSFLEGETVNHIYSKTGTYTLKVTALSGGAASVVYSQTITITDPVVLPVDFESNTISYTFNNFGGGLSTVVNNPASGGINTSAKVGKMVKNAGEVWGGSTLSLGNPIDFSTLKNFRMKVYSPRVGAKVLFKVENATNGAIASELEVATTVANQWEDLVFDFSTINTANSYQKITLIFDLGTSGNGSANFTFYFDDIRLAAPATTYLTMPITFDMTGVDYSIVDFGGNATVDAIDPINASNKVKKTTKTAGAQTWAGTTMGKGFATKVPFTASGTKMQVKVYSPAAGLPIRLKLEDRTDNTKTVETDTKTTKVNAWETIEFDFSKQVAGTPALNFTYNYNLASIFFNFGIGGTADVYYWDDVDFGGTTTTAGVSVPLDFESASLTYKITNFDGGNLTVENNTQKSGINTSNKVLKMVKGAGQTWGGSFITLDNNIDFSAGKTFKVKVFSPRAGAKILLKVENGSNGALNFEKEVLTTKTNEWEELSFDYSAINTANTYSKIVFIFDNGTMGTGSADFTFLLDDIKLN